MDERRLLRRSRVNRKVAGVCGGFGEFFDLDPVLVRVVWATLTIVPGALIFGMIAYVVAWLMIPETAPSSEPLVVASDNSWPRRDYVDPRQTQRLLACAAVSRSTSVSTPRRFVCCGCCSPSCPERSSVG